MPNKMKLSIYNLMTIKSALREMADDKRHLADHVESGRLRDSLLKDCEEIDTITAQFSDLLDRSLKADTLTVHEKMEISFSKNI